MTRLQQQRSLTLPTMLLLLLLLASARAKPSCPVQLPCQCTDLRIKCVQHDRQQLNYISRVPYFAPSNYETRWSYSFHEMRVRDQALTNLSLQFAWGVLSLHRIEVTNSLVRRILPNAFRGLLGVRSLNLSHNLLSSLAPGDLTDLPLLSELILHGNQIRAVYPGAFQRTPFIVRLYLSHNRLSEIPPDVRLLSGLTHLYLQFNNISVVRDYAFAGLRKLIILDLGALGRILRVESRAFCGLGSADSNDDEADNDNDVARSNSGSSDESNAAPVSYQIRERGLAALYLRRNIMQDLNLCALGKISGLRGLNLSGSIFPCTCQSASLANQSIWQSAYGFSPRYVTYESWQVANCEWTANRCSVEQGRQICPTTRCQNQPAYRWQSFVRGHSGVIRDWQYNDARLSFGRDVQSAGSGGPLISVWITWLGLGITKTIYFHLSL